MNAYTFLIMALAMLLAAVVCARLGEFVRAQKHVGQSNRQRVQMRERIAIAADGIRAMLDGIRCRRDTRQFANVAEGVHEDAITKRADGAIATRFLLVKEGSDDDHVAACGASDFPVGIASDEAEAAEDPVAVQFLNATSLTRKVVASEAIDVGETIYTAASGKVQNEPAAAGTFYRIGVAKQDSAADGDVIEIETHAPVKVVVIAALTSTDGTAAGAADLAALKTEAEKIGDDVRAIGAALATAAEVKVLA
jgi:hypothetical protein